MTKCRPYADGVVDLTLNPTRYQVTSNTRPSTDWYCATLIIIWLESDLILSDEGRTRLVPVDTNASGVLTNGTE